MSTNDIKHLAAGDDENGVMANEFKREHNRYVVIKDKDLTLGQRFALNYTIQKQTIPTRKCLVIEPEWPIYEAVWEMVRRLVQGDEQLIAKLQSERDALAAHLDRLERSGDWEFRAILDNEKHTQGKSWIAVRDESPTTSLARRDALKQSQGMNKAADIIADKAEAYNAEHGTTDPETGHREYPGDGAEYYNEMIELADELRQQAEGLQ